MQPTPKPFAYSNCSPQMSRQTPMVRFSRCCPPKAIRHTTLWDRPGTRPYITLLRILASNLRKHPLIKLSVAVGKLPTAVGLKGIFRVLYES